MNNLNKIENWKNNLGLLPIHLFSAKIEDKFILLNGGVGNFCIDTNPNKNPDEYFSYAWSSNTKNFVTVNNDRVFLYNNCKNTIFSIPNSHCFNLFFILYSSAGELYAKN